jgi:hypothetical protein
METAQPRFNLELKHPGLILGIWAVLLFASFVFSIFLHEDGHGFGVMLDGIQVSTGFNKVGDYGKSPDDPDFRSTGTNGAFWAGFLGPVTTWLLAIGFTIWFYRFKTPSGGAMMVGALAVANGLIRTLPMLSFLFCALQGQLHMEDEVGWGVWYVLKFCRPDLAATNLDPHSLLATYPTAFLSDYTFWISPLLSLSISLACLIPAYRRIFKVWENQFDSRASRLLFGLFPMAAFLAATPVLNWLDRLIRINW